MVQDLNFSAHYIADEGKIFVRKFDGIEDIERPYPVGKDVYLGSINFDRVGNRLIPAIEDKIEYYEEVNIEDIYPKEENEEVIEEADKENDGEN